VNAPGFLAGLGVEFIAVAEAILLRPLWWPVLGKVSPFLFFFSTLVMAAWHGGPWPGAIATMPGAICLFILGIISIEIGGCISHALA
jgi:hypothetical protein